MFNGFNQWIDKFCIKIIQGKWWSCTGYIQAFLNALVELYIYSTFPTGAVCFLLSRSQVDQTGRGDRVHAVSFSLWSLSGEVTCSSSWLIQNQVSLWHMGLAWLGWSWDPRHPDWESSVLLMTLCYCGVCDMLWREGTLLSEAPFPSSFAPQALMANLSLPPLLFFFFFNICLFNFGCVGS